MKKIYFKLPHYHKSEWVVVLKGEAKLLFESDDEPIHMKMGEFINIPENRKHRVEWTSASTLPPQTDLLI